MPRIARLIAVGLPHHVTQRGNYKQDVFLTADDRIQYLAWINQYSAQYGLSILVYSLMQNHIHFIAVPAEADSLAKAFNITHMRYSQYFNKKLHQLGHLWQGRFYSCVLGESHFLAAARYIERNPVRAGLVQRPWEWPWSSAVAHIRGGEDSYLNLGDFLRLADISNDAWKKYIDSPEKEDYLQQIRKYTLTGRPLGTKPFIEKLEAESGRVLQSPILGRPKKA